MIMANKRYSKSSIILMIIGLALALRTIVISWEFFTTYICPYTCNGGNKVSPPDYGWGIFSILLAVFAIILSASMLKFTSKKYKILVSIIFALLLIVILFLGIGAR